MRCPFPFPRSTRSALQSEGYGHPGGHTSDILYVLAPGFLLLFSFVRSCSLPILDLGDKLQRLMLLSLLGSSTVILRGGCASTCAAGANSGQFQSRLIPFSRWRIARRSQTWMAWA